VTAVLDRITPLILTRNEMPNVERLLGRLTWASRIVVVDSFSEDGTAEVLRRDRRIDVLQREFDTFASQCNFGLAQITTDWVLSLDADYVLSAELMRELERLQPGPATAGFAARFVYCVHGKRLRSTLYPPRPVLFRRAVGSYVQDGHAHRLQIDGVVERLSGPIYHDDRKPLADWLQSQLRYAEAEVQKLTAAPRKTLDRVDRLRLVPLLVPALIPFYCLLVKRLLLDGRRGLYYTAQRTFAELLISIRLLDDAIARSNRGASRP
jgi:glycosyltransferase involved in cell wall biosynthesis